MQLKPTSIFSADFQISLKTMMMAQEHFQYNVLLQKWKTSKSFLDYFYLVAHYFTTDTNHSIFINNIY